jgi:Holliday junction resolvase
VSKAQRDKGLRGELEVKQIFADAGFDVRSFEGQGDNLVIDGSRLLHLEVKRQETLKMDLWSRQAETECSSGAVPLVVYRRSREPWRVSLRLEDLLAVLMKS